MLKNGFGNFGNLVCNLLKSLPKQSFGNFGNLVTKPLISLQKLSATPPLCI